MHYLCAGIPHLHNVEGEEEKTEILACMSYFRISWVNRLGSNNTLTLPGHQRGFDATLSLPVPTPSFVFSRHSPDCFYPCRVFMSLSLLRVHPVLVWASKLRFCAWSPGFLTLCVICLSMLMLPSCRCCLASLYQPFCSFLDFNLPLSPVISVWYKQMCIPHWRSCCHLVLDLKIEKTENGWVGLDQAPPTVHISVNSKWIELKLKLFSLVTHRFQIKLSC